jgi:hypothetical protein
MNVVAATFRIRRQETGLMEHHTSKVDMKTLSGCAYTAHVLSWWRVLPSNKVYADTKKLPKFSGSTEPGCAQRAEDEEEVNKHHLEAGEAHS